MRLTTPKLTAAIQKLNRLVASAERARIGAVGNGDPRSADVYEAERNEWEVILAGLLLAREHLPDTRRKAAK